MMDNDGRRCSDCGTSIADRHRNAKRCYPCRDADSTRAAIARWAASPEGRARILESNKRYQQTEKGRAAVRRAVAAFLARPGGRESARAAVRRYQRRKRRERAR